MVADTSKFFGVGHTLNLFKKSSNRHTAYSVPATTNQMWFQFLLSVHECGSSSVG